MLLNFERRNGEFLTQYVSYFTYEFDIHLHNMMHKSEKLTSDPGTLIEINYFDDLFTSFFKHFIFQHYFQHFNMQILFSLLQILRKVKCLLLHVRHCILFMA